MFVMPGDRAGRQRVTSQLSPSATYNTPALSSFTWVNQGTSSVIQTISGQAIQLTIQNAATLNWRLLQSAQPTTPYKVIVQLRTAISTYYSSATSGIYFYDGTKLLGLEFLSQVGGDDIRVQHITNVTTDGSTQKSNPQFIGNPLSPIPSPQWVQMRNDGSTLSFDYSWDGQNFIGYYSEAVGSFITPTAVGFGGVSVNAGTPFLVVTIYNWSVVANASMNG